MHIQPIGIYFPQDETRQVINPTRLELIPKHWRPLLGEVQQQYRDRLGESLHSIWLRGSAARGTAVDHLSDLDTFALVVGPDKIRWQSAPWEKEVAEKLGRRYPFVAQIEFQLNAYTENFAEAFPIIAMILKTQSLHLWGADFRNELPEYRPGSGMCFYYRWIAEDVAEFLQKTSTTVDAWRSLMKTFIRVGFELVMAREGRFTLDLYCGVEAFSRYYPEKSVEMQLALHYFVHPPEDFSRQSRFVEEFGSWLEREVKLCFMSARDS